MNCNSWNAVQYLSVAELSITRNANSFAKTLDCKKGSPILEDGYWTLVTINYVQKVPVRLYAPRTTSISSVPASTT